MALSPSRLVSRLAEMNVKLCDDGSFHLSCDRVRHAVGSSGRVTCRTAPHRRRRRRVQGLI